MTGAGTDGRDRAGREPPGLRSALRAIADAARAGLPDPNTLPDGGFDPGFLDATAPLLEFLWNRYFRVRLSGMESVPPEGPALVVANHSGSLPYDGAMLIHAFHRHGPRQGPRGRPIRPLVATFALRSPFIRPVVARAGCVRASMRSALDLLARGELVAVFPEGLRGVGKPFRERYRLTHFGRGGFARLARAARVPMIPVAIVGAEEIHPVVAKLTAVARPFGLPYIPITPTFPWLGPLGLLPIPTKWSIRIGRPIPPPPPDANAGETQAVAAAVRDAVSGMIAEMLVERRSILFG